MADWICPRCGGTEKFWDSYDHECKNIQPICDKCWLTKPCECDDE